MGASTVLSGRLRAGTGAMAAPIPASRFRGWILPQPPTTIKAPIISTNGLPHSRCVYSRFGLRLLGDVPVLFLSVCGAFCIFDSPFMQTARQTQLVFVTVTTVMIQNVITFSIRFFVLYRAAHNKFPFKTGISHNGPANVRRIYL